MKRLAVLAVALAGCGAPSADLFSVERSGADRNANVRMVVRDDGTVTCDKQASKELSSKQLLDARQLARDLSQQAALSIDLPPERNSILRYVVRTEAGRVAFSDTSRGKPQTFDRVMAFTKDVVEDVCGITR